MMEKLSANEFDLNYKQIKEKIRIAAEKSNRKENDIILLAAIKTVDAETVNYAISKGINYIGENKVQEFLSKNEQIVAAHRHFIGHLQTNKVKDIVGKVEMIESVDSFKLAKEISKQSVKLGIVTEILLEVNIGGEEAKWGFDPENLLLAVKEISKFPGIKIKGLMTVAPICETELELRKFFRKMNKLFIDIGSQKIDNSSMEILSMGMSEDFCIAIEEGANLVRLGTGLFGKRIY